MRLATGGAVAPGAILVMALGIDVCLGLAHLINLAGLPLLDRPVELFDLDAERNLPTWWASMKLAAISLVLGLMLPAMRAMLRREWLLIAIAAVAFGFLSLDEFASLHEALGRRTRSDLLPTTGVWPFVFGGLGLAGAMWLSIAGRRLWAINPGAAVGLIGGLVGLAGTAAVFDLANNVFAPGHAALAGMMVVEEMGELFAVSAILYGAWSLARPACTGAVEGRGGPRATLD